MWPCEDLYVNLFIITLYVCLCEYTWPCEDLYVNLFIITVAASTECSDAGSAAEGALQLPAPPTTASAAEGVDDEAEHGPGAAGHPATT